MKIQALLLFFLSFFTVHILHSADHYQTGDKLYVWAKSGLNIRSAPDVKAAKIGKFSHGERVEVKAISDKIYHLNGFGKKGNGKGPFILTGNWVKVINENFEGYVIDIYLLKYTPPKHKMDFYSYAKSIVNESFKRDTAQTFTDCEEREADCFLVNAKASNGMEFQANIKWGIYTEALFFPGMTIEEGFVLSEYLSVVEKSIGELLKQPDMEIAHHLADRLILQEGDSLKIRYVKQNEGLRFSASVETYSSYYLQFRPDLLEGADFEGNIAEMLKITFISQEEYEQIKGLKTIQSVKKNHLVSQKDSTIMVQLENDSIKSFTSNNCVCESHMAYSYSGHFEEINAFAISATGWEDYEYDLYDSYSGEHIAYASESSIISPGITYLVSIEFDDCYDDYKGGTYFSVQLFNENGRIVERAGFSGIFDSWTITGHANEVKWENDQTFVSRIICKPFYKEKTYDFHENYRYARFRILK